MPDAYPDALAPVIRELADVMRHHLGDALAKTPHAIDRLVQEGLRIVGRGVSEQLYAEAARAAVDAAKSSARARGLKVRVERSPSITFTTVFGPVTVASPYLRTIVENPIPASQRTSFLDDPPAGMRPVNDALRVRSGGMTIQLQRVLTDFGLDASFEHAAQKVKEHYGLAIHRTTIRRAVIKHGSAAETEASVKEFGFVPDGPADGSPFLVEMDGSCVRTGWLEPAGTDERTPKRRLAKRKRTTEWRDLRLGFVRRLDGDDARFVGGILPLAAVAERLRGEAAGLGWTRSTVAVRITDGGHGVREALDRVFPTGVHILDRPHLHHHLFETAEAMGLRSAEAEQAKRRWATRLANGDVQPVVTELLAYDGPGKERAAQLAGYLQRFGDAVHYERFERLGYPIGSGDIASAHKGHAQARMKLPGTWWTPENANLVLALRLCRTNGRWEDHWREAA